MQKPVIFLGFLLFAVTAILTSCTVSPISESSITTYIVGFDSCGGSYVHPQSIPSGGKVIEPDTPIRTSYMFAGWYKDTSCSNSWMFADDIVVSNITLFAAWVPLSNMLLVVFDFRDGSLCELQYVSNNGYLLEPEAHDRAGYICLSWYIDPSCTQKWDFALDRVTNNMILYMRWEAIYTVTFDSMGGSAVSPQVATNGFLLKKPNNPSRAGYSFEGWFTETNFIHTWNFASNTVSNTFTLYARWEAIYTVTFDSMGGSAVSPQVATNGFLLKKPNNPSRAGYLFAGWFRETNFIHPWYFAGDIVANNTTVYAAWCDISLLIYFSYTTNGGSITITDFNTNYSGTFHIPVALNGYPVTSIGSEAFYSCFSLASVTISDSVTNIGSWAFFVCLSLASVTIPDSVTRIYDGTFSFCTNLKSVTIGSGVTRIDPFVFDGCDQLQSLYMCPMNAPITSPFSFQGMNPCTLHLKAGATGYNIPPWTSSFSSIVYDF